MVLSDRDIRERLIGFNDLGLGISLGGAMELVRDGKIPDGLRRALRDGKIIIEPFPDDLEKRLGSVSLDLGMDKTIWLPGTSEEAYDRIRDKVISVTWLELKVVDFSQPEQDFGENKKRDLSTEEFLLRPGETILATTQEVLMLPIDLMGRIVGRSRVARYGLSVSVEAPKIDPGFIGKVVLEISHRGKIGTQPIHLSPGLPLCQIIFEVLSSPSQRPYFEGGRFLGQEAP